MSALFAMQTNTKVFCSPKLLKRSDFNDINDFVQHVEDYRQQALHDITGQLQVRHMLYTLDLL